MPTMECRWYRSQKVAWEKSPASVTGLPELGVQAASDTVGDQERTFIDKEVQQLKNESERISRVTRFGSANLLDGFRRWFSIPSRH